MNSLYFFVKRGVLLTTLFITIIPCYSQLIISEFMASNYRSLADEDGSYEDWIEIHNLGTNTVNLQGWYLTDTKTDLRKWQFPSTNINAGGYIVVFASGKDRRNPGARLHTNFKLNNSGEYLALVKPDGMTIASEFSPAFPPQFSDISYGVAQASQIQKLISSNSPAKILIPSNGGIGTIWTEILFDDSSWISGTNGIGFDTGQRPGGESYAELKNYYSFNNNNAVDSVGSVSGSLNGSPSFSSGFSGQAINLNGTSQYISFLNLNLAQKFSISVWIKPTMKGNIMTIAANSGGGSATAGFRFFINQYQTTNGLINFETGDGASGAITRSLYPVNWGEWNNIVVVADRASGRGKIYLNGNDVTDPNANAVNPNFPTTVAWEIGRMSTAGFYFQGLIDDYAIWQGELSPTQIAALMAGAPPTNLIVFKQFIKTDIQTQMFSNNATAYIRIPFNITDPTAIQTLKLRMRYNDGFVAYLNGAEIVRKNAPESGLVADSVAEFSGIQGKDNWYYGYYDKTADPDQTYQPQNFIPFPASAGAYGTGNYWTGTLWDWFNGNPPWTELNSQGGHPNGNNNGNIHWAVRRWVSEVPGTLKINLRLAKSNPNCGTGTTGRILHNGVEKFSKAIGYNDSTGITTNVIIYNVNIGDFIDFVIDPTGTDGQPTDPCDGTIFTASIEHIAPPELTWNSSATTTRSDLLAIQFEEFDLYGMRRFLVPGQNILAIHGLNVSATNGNFFIEAELESATAADIQEGVFRYFAFPTPGAPNGAGVSDLGPIITDVSHSPQLPEIAKDILVTARITPTFAPISSNILYYRVMYASEIATPMSDDGNGGDLVPGDGVYSAIIPASAYSAGQMVRWYIVSIDTSNRVSRFPILTDTNRCPIYLGTVIKNPALTNPLPVFHWFIQNPAAADTDAGTRCSVFYNGIFYDNVYINIHGQSSRGFPKKSYDIEFNPGYLFQYDPNQKPVSDINFMTTYPDKAHMRNILAYETYREAGCAYHWVIPARVQQNGNFWGDVHLMENGDADFLERLGLDPNGPLYKMYNTFNSSPAHATIAGGNAEKKTRKWEGNADLLTLLNGVLQTGTNRTVFLYDNVDIPQMINMLATRVVTGDQDCCHKNYYLYRDTMGNGEWQAFPWDVDLSFGRRWISSLTYWDDTMVIDTRMPVGDNNGLFNALYQTPQIAEMYWRRLRTLMDELLQPPGTPTNQLKFEKRIDELTAIIAPDAALDLAKWGTWGNGSASSTCCIQTQPQAADIIKYTYLPQRRIYLFSNMVVTSGGRIPLAQPQDAKIGFAKIEFNPASGRQSEEYIQLTNINSFAVDISGWRLEGAIKHVFKPGTVIPSYGTLYVSPDVNAFRSRQVPPKGGMGLFVQGNYKGKLSARGEAILLLDKYGNFINIGAYTPNPSLAQQYLRITELMYNPAPVDGSGYDAQEFEYIELKNIGSAAISLIGVRFTNGINFDFSTSQVQSLSPGQKVLVVKNLNAFTSKYGDQTNLIAGVYSGNLDNNGERITLIDSNGEEILDFTYSDNWYPITDGFGFSLVIVNENAKSEEWNNKENWRPSALLDGSPANDDPLPVPIPQIFVNEVLSRSDNPPPLDTIELYNPNPYPVNISGWYLTDDFRTPKKYRIPDGTIIQPFSFWIVDESEFNKQPGIPPNFALSAGGDEVYLFSADTNGTLTGYYDGFEFGATENGITLGRFVTSDGKIHFVAQAQPTPGSSNSYPRIDDIIISEIMYNPPTENTNNPQLSFVEIANISTNAVKLFLNNTTNVWKLDGGIQYSFPTNTILQTGEKVLITGFNPESDLETLNKFRQFYRTSTNIRIFGPFSKKLNNDEDEIKLFKPNLDKSGIVMEVLVETVHYKDSLPWDAGADGTGLSLQRVNSNIFANEPTNWVAAMPTPGDSLLNWNPPVITAQPQSQIVFLGSNFALRVEVQGEEPIRYQWRFNGQIIESATNSTFVISNAQLYHSGIYQVSAINNSGSVSSAEAKISVLIPASILSQPQDITVFPGQPAVFGIAASSISSITYQWLKNGVPIAGATNSILTIPSAYPSDSGEYSVLVTDAVGTISSQPAKLTVLTHPLFILHPLTTNINPGSSATFTALATSSTPIRYQWRHNGIDIPGETNTSITIVNAQLEQSGIYTVVATDDYGSFESNPADLNVLVRPTIIKQITPSNFVARVGEEVNFEVGAYGLLPISYRWRQNSATVTNIIIRSTNCIFTITNVQFSNAGYYDVAITNVAGSAAGLTARAYLTVITPMSNAIVRPGSNALFTLNAKVTAATTVPANMALKYQWWFNDTNLITLSGTNFIVITNVVYENQGAYTVIATNSVGTIITQTAYLIIREKPIIVRHPVSQTIQSGQTVQFSIIAEDAEPILYKWFFNEVEIPSANEPTLIITNTQPSAAGRYYAIAYNNAGSATSDIATLLIQTTNDSDNDGMPDDWEIANGLNPNYNDAGDDPDGDGMTNLAEHIAGTNPNDPTSKLRISSFLIDDTGAVKIEFDTIADKQYTIEYKTNLDSDLWTIITNLTATSNKLIIKEFPSSNNKQRFYRIGVKK
ncbi:MAG: lamin tail domain-containing protein [Verrucomicrobiia bacterium]